MTILESLAAELNEIGKSVPRGELYCVGICGVPGSGKSSAAQYLATHVKRCAHVPMDGYHYYRTELEMFPDPQEAFRRRGAPFTFDSESFARDIHKLKETGKFSFPDFDHAAKDPRPHAICVDAQTSHSIVVFEGLYLYLDSDAGFKKVSSFLDQKWFLDADLEESMTRLAHRHVETGVADSMTHAMERINGNDRQNGELVNIECRKHASRIIPWPFDQSLHHPTM
eukprot:ANDGO_02604.mRNA.1 Putative uridine kinase C227.14